jgi:catechol 2,3-dioxygenase-like lactoylglutathione lyase family enzyme
VRRVERILETSLYVDDLAVARQFYTQVLGLEIYAEQPGRHLFFRVGNQMLLLFDPKESNQPVGTFPSHGTQGAGHVCFAVRDEAELDEWQAQLESQGVTIERIHVWPGGARSLYFRDPAGNSLEFTTPGIWGIEQ